MKKAFFVLIICFILSPVLIGAPPEKGKRPPSEGYTIDQAVSDRAQLSTIAFSGLSFITGNRGADTFMPPGKVADFFGFQYMRDVDTAGYGHNSMFLTRAANNVLHILTDEQKTQLVSLAREQTPLYAKFAYNRFPLMDAFRRNLEGKAPSGAKGLNSAAVSSYCARLYRIDAELSYNRALVIGGIISSFTDSQKEYLAKMKFDNFKSWPDVPEDEKLKRGMKNSEFIAVMTYASELFSWYKGSSYADTYFCPERHGTYFGGFFLKDYPAMKNPGYFISTSLTGDSGEEFLKILDSVQRELVEEIIDEQKSSLNEIVKIRTAVSEELRKAMSGGKSDRKKIFSMIERYGELDGKLSALYASRFAEVNRTLTSQQRLALFKLRNLDAVPEGAYRFSTPVPMPDLPDTDYFFLSGKMPADAGNLTPSDAFLKEDTPGPERGRRPPPGNRLDEKK